MKYIVAKETDYGIVYWSILFGWTIKGSASKYSSKSKAQRVATKRGGWVEEV